MIYWHHPNFTCFAFLVINYKKLLIFLKCRATSKWVRLVFFYSGRIYLNNTNNCRGILPMWEINYSNFRRPKRPECEREAELYGSGTERIKLQVRWCIYSWSGDKRACAWWTCLVMGINRSCSAPATCSAAWNMLPSKICEILQIPPSYHFS